MLSEILCHLLRDLCVSLRDSCVRGFHPIFRPPNIGTHGGFSRKIVHDATTEEVQEEHSH
jgi:hypothetical protein